MEVRPTGLRSRTQAKRVRAQGAHPSGASRLSQGWSGSDRPPSLAGSVTPSVLLSRIFPASRPRRLPGSTLTHSSLRTRCPPGRRAVRQLGCPPGAGADEVTSWAGWRSAKVASAPTPVQIGSGSNNQGHRLASLPDEIPRANLEIEDPRIPRRPGDPPRVPRHAQPAGSRQHRAVLPRPPGGSDPIRERNPNRADGQRRARHARTQARQAGEKSSTEQGNGSDSFHDSPQPECPPSSSRRTYASTGIKPPPSGTPADANPLTSSEYLRHLQYVPF